MAGRGRGGVHCNALHYFAHFLLMTISIAILRHCLAFLLSQMAFVLFDIQLRLIN